MVDIILPISVISKYAQLMKPFTCLGSSFEKSAESIRNKNMATPLVGITNLNNESLPLIHLEFKGFRLMMPVLTDTKLQHDLLMLQVVKHFAFPYNFLIRYIIFKLIYINIIYYIVGRDSYHTGCRKSNLQNSIANRHISTGCSSKYIKCTRFGCRRSSVSN